MHILKLHEKPYMLSFLNSLNKRAVLSSEEKKHLLSLKKGFEGELHFELLMKKILTVDSLVINSLLLTINNTTCQIDSLLITNDTIYMYEIKNYKGNYINQTDYLQTSSGQEILNPLNQLKRTSMLFRQLLKKWDCTISLKPLVIYINPNFILYNAKYDDPVVFPPQIKSHLEEINRQKRSLSSEHKILAEKLIKEHREETTFQRKLPNYKFKSLKKGLTCGSCSSFKLRITEKKCYCQLCDFSTTIDKIVLKEVEEFKLLFPNEKITRNNIYYWCGERISKKRIWNILRTNFKRQELGNYSYYQ